MDEKWKQKLYCFIEEYNQLIFRGSYLGKREFICLMKKHHEVLSNFQIFKGKISDISYQMIEGLLNDDELKWIDRYNELYMTISLNKYRTYFDTLFTNYHIPIVLDEDQRRAILDDEEASLIIAGAGTGKTTTMSAKVKYLVDIKGIDPSKILVLSYTKKAVGELSYQIRDVFSLPVTVMTFHALGRKVVNARYPNGFMVFDERAQSKLLFNYVRDVLFPNKPLMESVISLYPEHFSKSFRDNFKKYSDFSSYFSSYKEKRYQDLKRDGRINEYIDNREKALLSRNHPTGLNLQKYRSKKEAEIANFLYRHLIKFEYEMPASFLKNEDFSYHPDFILEIYGKQVVVEYFGLMEYQENGRYTQDDINLYRKIRNEKEILLRQYQIDFIFLEGKDTSTVLNTLKTELTNRGVRLEKKSEKEIIFCLLDDRLDVECYDFISEMNRTISKLKENGANEGTFQDILAYYKSVSVSPEEMQTNSFNLYLIRDIFSFYQGKLKENSGIDFSDMINYAYDYLKKNPEEKNLPRYDYLLIDEYQDISFSRFLLARQIVENFQTKIVAVGDDWQTIFTFAGSNIRLFYNFKKQFPHVSEHKITHTYRNSQQLIDTAGNFIIKNKEQIKKRLFSDKFLPHPIEIVIYSRGCKNDVICRLLDNIYQQDFSKHVFLLARTNAAIENIFRQENLSRGPDTQVIYKKYPEMKIDALTVHSAKGLTCDDAIILDLKQGVFPSTRMEKNIVYCYYRKTGKVWEESYPFAEERRLFYVALTRTKNKVYLLSSENKKEESIFVTELRGEENVMVNENFIEVI